MAKCLKICRSCLSETTAHGLNNVINESSKLKRVLWLCFSLFALSVFIYHTTKLALQLRSKPVSITILPNSVHFPQPDIYFCFDRPISNSYLRNPPNKDYKAMKNLSNYIDNLMEYAPKKDLLPNTLGRILSNVNHRDFFKVFGLRYSETLISALCNGINIDLSFINYKEHLACLRVTPLDCPLSSTWSKLSLQFYVHNFPLNEYDEGNNITFNYSLFSFIDNIYGFEQTEVTEDIMIYFEDAGSTIPSELNKVTASSKTHTKVKLSSEITEKINRNDHKCNEITYALVFHNYFNISQPIELNYLGSIFIYETQMHFKENYNCVLAEILVPLEIDLKKTPFCLNIRHPLWSKTEREIIDIYTEFSINTYIPKEPLCTDIKYTTKVSTSRWPTNTIGKKLITNSLKNEPGISESETLLHKDAKNIEQIKENFYKITIELANENATMIREELRYTWINFFSDVGGIMGFYLGASVLTLCEITKVLCSCFQLKSNKQREIAENKEEIEERTELKENV